MTASLSVYDGSNRPRPAGPLAGKTALITGGDDRGIGGAIAERLARDGADIELASLAEPQRLLKRLRRIGATANWSLCDVTVPEQVDAAIAAAVERHGALDCVVNNAGIEFVGPLAEMSEVEASRQLDVNLGGTVRVTRTALPFLNDGSAIINISSALALAGCPGFSIYSAAKAGMIGLTQSLAWELAPRRIRVVGVAPGIVHTPMLYRHAENATKEHLAQIEACHPLCIGSPHDVAASVAFLASPDARWITGITMPIGWTGSLPLPVAQFASERSTDAAPQPASPNSVETTRRAA
ncbi:MAG: SDR family oxidoreductase [Planctomycetales bacterium]|nr:SDR family oxidoreductase [Planctomycetales bacterium]